MQIDVGMVLIPLFRIDVPASSKGIKHSFEVSRVEADDEAELREEL